jgi:hypothetical protein
MKEKFVIIFRDPVARSSIVRRVVVTSETCKWCGRARTKEGKLTNTLFQYGVFNDDAPFPYFRPPLFCSVDCMRTYYFG